MKGRWVGSEKECAGCWKLDEVATSLPMEKSFGWTSPGRWDSRALCGVTLSRVSWVSTWGEYFGCTIGDVGVFARGDNFLAGDKQVEFWFAILVLVLGML